MRRVTVQSGSLLAGITIAACSPPPPPCAPTDRPETAPPRPPPAVEVAPVAPGSFDPRDDACREGDAAACEELFARYLIGEGVEPSPERARSYQQRAWELRMSGCTQGRETDCRHLPGQTTPMPLALAPTDPSAPTPVEPARRVVTVDAKGAITVDGQTVTDLDRELPRHCGAGEAAVVAADQRVAYREVVQLLDALKKAGCTRISFAIAAP